jgi:signal transduction histidine kinase
MARLHATSASLRYGSIPAKMTYNLSREYCSEISFRVKDGELLMQKGHTFVKNIPAVLLGATLLAGLYLTSLYSFLLFHSLIEFFTILVAAGIFVIAWNARGLLNNNYLLFIGIAAVFMALLDLLHTLAYKGMGVFTGQTDNLATQLWVAARYLQSLSLLIAPFYLRRKLNIPMQVAVYTIITAFIVGAIFNWRIFPNAFVSGTGLTPFKKISEYIISALFLVSIGLLVWKRREFDPGVLRSLVLFLVFTISSELAFTTYISVYGNANMVGHFLRLIAFYFLYKAVIETGLVRPYAILFRDLQRSEESLREQSSALEARNGELDAYAHTVAHDLKNPLTVIISISDALNEIGDLTLREKKEFLEQIRSTAFEMNGIIDNLLLLSEIRKVEAPRAELDMSGVVANIRRRMNFEIKKRQARVIIPKSWPVSLGYAPWVEEVWTNYISNALKYGGQPPCVELGAAPQLDGTNRFWVRDNGAGISPETRGRLFRPFSQVGKVHAAGHGLGLSIVRRIIERLGGEVGVESEIGRGSLFYFTLPAVVSRMDLPACQSHTTHTIDQAV